MTPLSPRSTDMCHHTLKTGLDCHLASETVPISCCCTASSELSSLFGVCRDISNGIAWFKTKEARITDLLSLWLLNSSQITLLCCTQVASEGTLWRSHLVLFSFLFFSRISRVAVAPSSLHTSVWCSIYQLWTWLLVFEPRCEAEPLHLSSPTVL